MSFIGETNLLPPELLGSPRSRTATAMSAASSGERKSGDLCSQLASQRCPNSKAYFRKRKANVASSDRSYFTLSCCYITLHTQGMSKKNVSQKRGKQML